MHTEVKHPLIKHKMSILRNKETGAKLFRELAGEITQFLAYEALRDIPTSPVDIETPIATAKCECMTGPVVLVPILRAGIGMLNPLLELVPTARVGFLGMYRDHDTAKPIEYYSKIPESTPDTVAFVIDPMLATAGSAVAAVDKLKRLGFEKIRLICIVSCPEGISNFEGAHPDVPIFTASIDEGLTPNKYIIPGLGDAGDRLFGTK